MSMQAVCQISEYLATLSFESEPDYDYLRELLKTLEEDDEEEEEEQEVCLLSPHLLSTLFKPPACRPPYHCGHAAPGEGWCGGNGPNKM